MKKAFTAIILLVYFTVTTGFVVSRHYCMDRMDSIQLGSSESKKCGKCGMAKDENNCCRDEEIVVKLETTPRVSPISFPDFSLPVIANTTTDFLLSPVFNCTILTHPLSNGPPLSDQQAYLLNCVFRI